PAREGDLRAALRGRKPARVGAHPGPGRAPAPGDRDMRRGAPDEAALEELARAYGVVREYRNDQGERVSGSRDAVVAALRALGAPLDGERDAEAALAEVRAARAERLAEPVIVAWDGEPASLGLPADAGRVHVTLTWEDGSEEH